MILRFLTSNILKGSFIALVKYYTIVENIRINYTIVEHSICKLWALLGLKNCAKHGCAVFEVNTSISKLCNLLEHFNKTLFF